MSKIDIRNTENKIIGSVKDMTINPNETDTRLTSITLFGKGTETYLKELNENFYAILENFASKKAPKTPLPGQIWYAKKGSNIIEAKGTGLNNSDKNTYIKINGVDKQVKKTRGMALLIIDSNFKNAIVSLSYYDIYGSDAARTQLANKLDSISADQAFIMVSYDAIGTNTALNKKMSDLKSNAWYKITQAWRYQYAAIGTGALGIISEDLKGFDEKSPAMAFMAFESLSISDGMGMHARLSSSSEINDNLLIWNGSEWISDAMTIEGKDLNSLRTYILSGVDLSVKFDKSGGTLNGSLTVNSTFSPSKNILPTGNEIQDLGSKDRRYSKIYLSETKSIYMGTGLEFGKNSFVYSVEKDSDSVEFVPAGALIINKSTGEAVVKRASYVKGDNLTFDKLGNDKKYGVVVGGNNYNFKGDTGIWMGSWNHNKIQKVSIPTTSNTVDFGTCRAGGHSAGASDGTRGLSIYQHTYAGIQYITISTPMNAVDFGKFEGGNSPSAASDGTIALIIGGADVSGSSTKAQYVLFSTPMNSLFYSNLSTSSHWAGAVSDGTKAIFDRGLSAPEASNFYSYISMKTLSNGVTFGSMQQSRIYNGATSNGIYGVWLGGYRAGVTLTNVERLTLATVGNSSSFGNLSYARHSPSPVSNDNVALSASGSTATNVIDSISYASGGTATKFGDSGQYIRYAANFSGN